MFSFSTKALTRNGGSIPGKNLVGSKRVVMVGSMVVMIRSMVEKKSYEQVVVIEIERERDKEGTFKIVTRVRDGQSEGQSKMLC